MKKNKIIIKVFILTIVILLGNKWVSKNIISLDLPYEAHSETVKYYKNI